MTSVLMSLLATLRGVLRSRAALHLEVLALRHQLQGMQRSQPRRLRLAKADRGLWAWLSQAWSGWRTSLVIVKPATVLAWHRQGFRLFWNWKSRRRTVPPTMGWSSPFPRWADSIIDTNGAPRRSDLSAPTRGSRIQF